jgi:hypothetical protein
MRRRATLFALQCYNPIIMTNYNLTPLPTLPSLGAQEKKEKRRKVLEAVRERRRARYIQFLHKLQTRRLQANDEML